MSGGDETRAAGRPDMAAMGFAGNRLLRDSENRDETTLARALADPAARVYLKGEDGWFCRTADGRIEPGLDAAALAPGAGEIVLLGRTGGGAPRLAMSLAAGSEPPPGLEAKGLRALGTEGRLDPDTEGQLAQAEHLLNWHGRTRFCGRCGTPTVSEAAGYRRRCPACGEMHFPRTDPVAIMLIHDGADRCLLGRSPRFPPGMWSCLAGFIEPGETLEDAVRRETFEEAGIVVGPVAYAASQPWPFPGSLMIGCIGRATSSEIAFDTAELEDCRWFGREESVAMLAGRHREGLTAPLPFAIAHHLVRRFADGDV